ncbi:MAG: hypothetical protein IJX65_06595 [Alistipes sp.]|nr:hypothetical protein [Alistipes sp.]
MKKILLALAFVFCAASVSAQGWALGGRLTGGIQAQVEYTFSSENYLEGRVGLGILNGTGLDVTALYQWNCFNWDWTPRAGQWFFDAGVGASGGFWNHKVAEAEGVSAHQTYSYVGVTGCAKFGIKFNGAPVKLAIDYSPTIGPEFAKEHCDISTRGFYNLGISCVYCF